MKDFIRTTLNIILKNSTNGVKKWNTSLVLRQGLTIAALPNLELIM